MDLGFLGFRYMPLIDKNYYEQEPLLLEILREDPEPYRIYTGKIHGGRQLPEIKHHISKTKKAQDKK